MSEQLDRLTSDEEAERANVKAALAGVMLQLREGTGIRSVEVGLPEENHGTPFLEICFEYLRSPYRLTITRDRSVEGGLDGKLPEGKSRPGDGI